MRSVPSGEACLPPLRGLLLEALRAALALGQYEAARESLLKAKGAAEAQEERAILWQILVTLSDVEGACGNADSAEKLRGKARAVVDDIAAHAGEMQDVFLSQPAVVQLMSDS